MRSSRLRGPQQCGAEWPTRSGQKILDVAVAALERDGVRYRESDDLAWHKAHEGARFVGAKYAGVDGSYGNTAMSPHYVREHWTGTGFEVARVVEESDRPAAGRRRAAQDIAGGRRAVMAATFRMSRFGGAKNTTLRD